MKKFMMSAILVCISFLHMPATENPTSDGPELVIIIEIGKIADCSFAPAFCKLIVGVSGLKALVGGSQFVSGVDGASWVITIPEKELGIYYPDMAALLEGQDSITFAEGFEASDELKRAMGANKDLIIRANNTYPVRLENGEYIITIKL